MVDTRIEKYIETYTKKGYDKYDLANELIKKGYTPKAVNEAILAMEKHEQDEIDANAETVAPIKTNILPKPKKTSMQPWIIYGVLLIIIVAIVGFGFMYIVTSTKTAPEISDDTYDYTSDIDTLVGKKNSDENLNSEREEDSLADLFDDTSFMDDLIIDGVNTTESLAVNTSDSLAVNFTCTGCSYTNGSTCITALCCENIDCDDTNQSTLDSCAFPNSKNASCTYLPAPICGDLSCNGNETNLNCCTDCGCPNGLSCSNNTCIAQQGTCFTSADCDDALGCTTDFCSNGVCQNNPIDYCFFGDNCCPSGCDALTDDDCSFGQGVNSNSTQPSSNTTNQSSQNQSIVFPQTVTVTMNQQFGFKPGNVSVPVKSTLNWKNIDSGVPHSVIGPGFDSGVLMSGGEYNFTFMTKGSYEYRSGIHGWMKGVVIVT